ncbi:MAG: hypothetical protein ACRBCT_02050 [Alphaproteobacteria bacterium]
MVRNFAGAAAVSVAAIAAPAYGGEHQQLASNYHTPQIAPPEPAAVMEMYHEG